MSGPEGSALGYSGPVLYASTAGRPGPQAGKGGWRVFMGPQKSSGNSGEVKYHCECFELSLQSG
jgi:hypothetical protein